VEAVTGVQTCALPISFEDKIMADLRLNKVDFVALVERNADEYGQGEFGGTYGRRLMEDILSHYEVRHRFGQSAVLLGRKR
jgi:hypothetical protein